MAKKAKAVVLGVGAEHVLEGKLTLGTLLVMLAVSFLVLRVPLRLLVVPLAALAAFWTAGAAGLLRLPFTPATLAVLPIVLARLLLRPKLDDNTNGFAVLCAWLLHEDVDKMPVDRGGLKNALQTQGLSLDVTGRIASYSAAQVVAKLGPRLTEIDPAALARVTRAL